MRTQRLEATIEARACLQHLPCRGLVRDPQGVEQPELEPIEPAFLGELVIKRFMRDAACGTPKPRKAPAIGPLL